MAVVLPFQRRDLFGLPIPATKIIVTGLAMEVITAAGDAVRIIIKRVTDRYFEGSIIEYYPSSVPLVRAAIAPIPVCGVICPSKRRGFIQFS